MNGSDCGTVQDLLPEYVAGELSAAAAARVRDHLVSCEVCREEAELVELLRSSPVEVPAGLESRVMSALERATPRTGSRWRTQHYALAATVAFAAITGSLIWQQVSEQDNGSPTEMVIAPAPDEVSVLRSPGLSALSEEELLALLEEIES